MSNDTSAGFPLFLSGGGETGALMRARDWSKTSLGAAEHWPVELKTLVGVMLGANQPMFIAWGDQRIMLYNDGYAELCRDRHPAAMGSPFATVWHDIMRDVGPILDGTFAGQSTHMDDIMFMMERDGAPRETHFSFSYTPVRDPWNTVVGLFCACAETTEQVFAERRLKGERESFAALFQQAPTIMAMLRGPDHVIELANPSYLKLVGNREVLGRTVADALPDAVRQGYLELLDGVFSSKQAFSATAWKYDVQSVPGGPVDERYLDFVYQPIIDASGKVTGIFLEGFDVTEREAASRALRDSEARLKALNADLERQVAERSRERGRTWQVTPDLLSITNADGFFDSVNPAFTTTLGWSETEMRRHRFDAWIHPDDLAASYAVFEHARLGQPVLQFENRVRTASGDYRWLSWVSVPEGGKIYSSARDITAQKDADARLEEASEQLRQAQKMEAVGQLTGGLAHDFNNLLAGISGSLELLQKRVAQGRLSEIDRFVDGAQGAARRAAALTHRLLAFSRRQTLDPKPTDANRLVGDMAELIRRTVGPSIELEVVGMAGLWITQVDQNQLENALLNLAINGRDAMPDGGRLTIETANRWIDEVGGRERDLPPGQYVSVTVSDTGTGMTPEIIARAFDPFFTTKPMGEGTGLGLSMIYGFARQSGGQVRIYSELGQGSTLSLYLPRHQGSEELTEDQPERHDMPRADEGETVLVIDDEPSVRMLVTEVLQDLGYVAIEAGDGPAGLKIVQSGQRIDLLITDVGLPGGMNGRQVADAARALRPALKVLFITGYAENAVVGNGHLDPGMHIMTKPFTLDALASRIRSLIEQR
jgi:PAS domain S-box-containing protein